MGSQKEVNIEPIKGTLNDYVIKDKDKIVVGRFTIAELDKENHRTAKANESYYLLKKTKTPTVIVECGFLSNRQEAELLSDAEYQQKVAVAISKGIENYLNEEAESAKKP